MRKGFRAAASPAQPANLGVDRRHEDLDAETSESWGAGVVWRPSFLPRLSLEANYFDIQVDGAIQVVEAEVLLTRCAVDADPLSCATIGRTASGQISPNPRFPSEHRQHRDDGVDATLNFRTARPAPALRPVWTKTSC